MKIAISGKGGVGKTTIAALLSQWWGEKGLKVIAIDADPDPHLAGMLGYPAADSLTPISQLQDVISDRTGAKPNVPGQIFKLNPRVDDLPERFGVEHKGIRIIVMGAIKSAGQGCACPENTFLKALTSHLVLQRNEYLIMDMPAGLEHLGRGTARAVDVMLIVSEPASGSVETAKKIVKLARELTIRKIKLIGNKILSKEDELFIRTHIPDVHCLAFLPLSENMKRVDREGLDKVGLEPFQSYLSGIEEALK